MSLFGLTQRRPVVVHALTLDAFDHLPGHAESGEHFLSRLVDRTGAILGLHQGSEDLPTIVFGRYRAGVEHQVPVGGNAALSGQGFTMTVWATEGKHFGSVLRVGVPASSVASSGNGQGWGSGEAIGGKTLASPGRMAVSYTHSPRPARNR